jgi:hypothetical protein
LGSSDSTVVVDSCSVLIPTAAAIGLRTMKSTRILETTTTLKRKTFLGESRFKTTKEDNTPLFSIIHFINSSSSQHGDF